MKPVEIKTEVKLLSIIVPNFFMNKPGRIIDTMDEELWFAEKCFEKLKRNTFFPFELILIDNGSRVGKELLKREADVLITNRENLGFAPACNQGFDIAKGEWVAVINNDIFLYRGWIEALIKTFEDNKDCGVAMPALMKQTGDAKIAYVMGEINLDKNWGKYTLGAEFGSCWLSKKEILDELRQFNGGKIYDENFKIGFGEDRLMWRQIRWLGYQTYKTHNTRVFHQGNVTVGKIENRKSYTGPNRIYLKKLLDAHEKGKKYTEKEKIQLRIDADREWRVSQK